MKLFCHQNKSGSNNCYVVGSDPDQNEKVALIIDPGHIDQQIIDFIENNDYTLGGILVTHEHNNHVRGIQTLMRLYKTAIFAANPLIAGYKTTMVRDGDVFRVQPFRIEVFSIPGHAADAVIYNIDMLLFTGDSLSAGLTGATSSYYAERVQANALQSKIFSLPGDYIVLPGHGPPSSMGVERQANAGIQHYIRHKVQPTFLPDLDF